MQPSGINIGTINLAGFEIPSSITFGGSQRVVVHRLAGGGSQIEALGVDDGDIWLSGAFTGSDAEARARALDALRRAGKTVPLRWQSFEYEVLLQSFHAVYTNPSWISYTVGLVVVRDLKATSDAALASSTSIDAALQAARDLLDDAGVGANAIATVRNLDLALLPGTAAGRKAVSDVQQTVAQVDRELEVASGTLALVGENAASVTNVSSKSVIEAAGRLALLTRARALLISASVSLQKGI